MRTAFVLLFALCSFLPAQEIVQGQPTQRWDHKTDTWTDLRTGERYKSQHVAGGEIVKPIEKTAEAERIDRLARSGAVVDFGSRKLWASYTCLSPLQVASGQCWWCPKCNCWHCEPKPGGSGQPVPLEPQDDYPQYEPYPPPETEPPADPPTTEPPATNPPLPPPPTEPTIDQAALEQFKAEAVAEATAQAKAEVSILIKQELANVQACDCAAKWSALELRLTSIEQQIGNAGDAQATVNVNVQNALTALAESIEAAQPNVDEVADEVLARLDHDTPIRVYLPDGRLAGESKTNIFRGESIDFTFNPRALLDSTQTSR